MDNTKVKLSLVIPSFNRRELLLKTIKNIQTLFKNCGFEYEIIVVNSGVNDLNNFIDINQGFNFCNVKVFNIGERKFPGIARQIGVDNSNGKWIWFIDDDDGLEQQNLNELFSLMYDDLNDLIAHSLKFNYELFENPKTNLLKNISFFKEKQEVFNFIIKKSLILENKITFSSGVHEDIRYVVELLIHCRSIKFLNKKVYNKLLNSTSITKTLTKERIKGYLTALKDIINLKNDFVFENKHEMATQTIGTILYLINSSDDSLKDDFLKFLCNNLTNETKLLLKNNYTEKNTNFKYSVSLFLKELDGGKDFNNLKEKLDYCFRTFISCRDLRNSLFLGPQEIIGCCKRFFYKGERKGDIILLSSSKDITLQKIIEKKEEIQNSLNRDTFDECLGCPYIERFEKQDSVNKINYISLENFSYCNMKCSYCSPRYYAGKESIYDAYKIIQDLIDKKFLSDDTHIVYGGGEPTLDPKFKNITEKLISNDKISTIRILSNSLMFSKNVENFINNDKIRLVTSIDAGTQNKFKKIRGKGEIYKVLENLKIYNKNSENSKKIILKYIITEDNFQSDEIFNFVDLLLKFGFCNNFIQISCNFKINIPSDEMIFSIYELSGRLLNSGFLFIYFDDLIRDRLQIDEKVSEDIFCFLKSKNLLHENILTKESNKKVIIWGDGYQANWIQNKTMFGKSGGVIKVVRNENDILDSDIVDDLIICPAGVQLVPDIYQKIRSSKVKDKLKFCIFL